MHWGRSNLAILIYFCFVNLGLIQAQAPGNATKYKLTILEGASTSKRVKKGRVSSQAVVKLTDENDLPVAGIGVTFAIPQLTSGAAFANGTLTSIVTTNAAGIASSGSFSAAAGSSFSVGVSASVPGGVLTAAVPVTTAAAAAAGISTGVLVGIIAGVGAAAAVGIKVATNGKGSSTSSTPPGSTPNIIGSPGTIVFH